MSREEVLTLIYTNAQLITDVTHRLREPKYL